MNLENLRTKLIAAARHDAPADDVPYAFEKRIQARIRNQPIEDIWSLWANGLWKGAAACAAISANDPPAAPFETVVLAGADELTESW
jgi:hypothetical protein